MKKRILAILLCLCMTVAWLPGTARAISSAQVFIGDGSIGLSANAPCYVNNAGSAVPDPGDDNWNAKAEFDGFGNISKLTLKNLNSTKIAVPSPVEIVLDGENTLTTTENIALLIGTTDSSSQKLTISGDGSLTVSGGKGGICAGEIEMTGGTVTASGSEYGVKADVTGGGITTSLTVSGGELTGKCTGDSGYGLLVGHTSVTGGTVTGESENGVGIGRGGRSFDITVSGGKLIGTGATFGISASSITASGGEVSGTSTSETTGTGIEVSKLTVSDSAKVTGTGYKGIGATSSNDSGYHITVTGGGTVEGHGTGIGSSYPGILAGSLKVEEGTVTGDNTNERGVGIVLGEDIDIAEGQTVTGKGDDTGIVISGNEDITLSSGTLKGIASGDNNSSGIFIQTAGTVTVDGAALDGENTKDGCGIQIGDSNHAATLKVKSGTVTGNGVWGFYFKGANFSAEGGTVTGTGTKYGIESANSDGTLALSCGTFTGGETPVHTADGKSATDLLAEGYGYFLEDGSLVPDNVWGYTVDFDSVTVKQKDPSKLAVSMRLERYGDTVKNDDGTEATVTLFLYQPENLPDDAEVTVECTSHTGIAVTKTTAEWGDTLWTATVPTGSGELVTYEFKASYAGDETHYPASAVYKESVSKVVLKFASENFVFDEGGEQTLTLTAKNLPADSKLTVVCYGSNTNDIPVTMTDNGDGTWTGKVTLPEGDASYGVTATCWDASETTTFAYAFSNITVGSGIPSMESAEMNFTVTPQLLNGGGTVSITVTGKPADIADVVRVSCSDETIELKAGAEKGTWTVTLPNLTKTYVFTAVYPGNNLYYSSSMQSGVEVTAASDTPDPAAPSISGLSYDYATGRLSWTGENIPATGAGGYFWVQIFIDSETVVTGSGRECMETTSDPMHIQVTKSGSTYSCTYKPVELEDGEYKVVIGYRGTGGSDSMAGYTFTVGGSTAPTTPTTPTTPDTPTTPSAPNNNNSSSNNSSSNQPSNNGTTQNPDGSTTTVKEDKTTGTITETTKSPDGSETVVETKKDGTVTVTETDAAGNKSTEVQSLDGSRELAVTRTDGTTATVSTDASGKSEAEVNLSSSAVSSAQVNGEAISLPIPRVTAARNTASASVVTVNTGSSVPVKVEVPAANVTSGTVAVIVKADGSEEVIKSSVPTAGGVAVSLPDGATIKIVDNSKTFQDVPAGSWAADAVNFSAARELFSGTSETTFAPETPMTRAMLITVLARYDGVDTSGGATWYEKGISWAVASGISDGSDPNGSITREQLAVMLWRYSGSPAPSGALSMYTDADNVGSYARDALCWAVENGIVSGFGNGQLGPKEHATRAQVAQMLKNFIEK